MDNLKSAKIVIAVFFIVATIRLLVAVMAIWLAEKGLHTVNISGFFFWAAFVLSVGYVYLVGRKSRITEGKIYGLRLFHVIIGLDIIAGVYSIYQLASAQKALLS